MTLGYKQNFPDGTPTYFKEKIIGISPFLMKLHSIREDPSDRWPPSTGIIHHVYGNRTPQRECFLVNKCVSTQRIIIKRTTLIGQDEKGNDHSVGHTTLVLVDGRAMDDEQIQRIAINDGFPSVKKFFEWFNTDFSGKIIHWTKLRY